MVIKTVKQGDIQGTAGGGGGGGLEELGKQLKEL